MVINTATKKAGTLQTGLETASISANTAAKSLGAKATALLTIATSKLNAVIAANAWTIALAGTVALGYGVYKLITYQTEAEKWQGKLNDRFGNSIVRYLRNRRKLTVCLANSMLRQGVQKNMMMLRSLYLTSMVNIFGDLVMKLSN